MRSTGSTVAPAAAIVLGLVTSLGCDAGPGSERDAAADGGGEDAGPTMPCSDLTCSLRTEYCYVVSPSSAGGQGSIECRELPDACRLADDPGCDCLDPGPGFACSCAEDPEDAFMLHCTGP
jgi:hypothetical protein